MKKEEKKVIRNVKKRYIKSFIITILPAIFFIVGAVLILINLINDINIYYIVGIIIFLLLAYGFDKTFIDSLIVLIEPMKADLFKKYGSPKNICEILEEVNKSKLYEDNHLIISKNYICDKKDFNKIVACIDVYGIHEMIHKTQGSIDSYNIIITDKYKEEFRYKYANNEIINMLIKMLHSLCPNSEVGYTWNEIKHINNNYVKIGKNQNIDYKVIKNNKDIKIDQFGKTIICPKCNTKVLEMSLYCTNCGKYLHSNIEELENNEDGEKVEEVEDIEPKYECRYCGEIVKDDDQSCPNCGLIFKTSKDKVLVKKTSKK